jgi:DNA-binding CsgD family transcriptional regulator/tetratricopeptide (TPR) repeat protein
MIRSDYRAGTNATAVQLPGPLRLTPSFPFAGRSRELATLGALVPRAEGEGRRIALVGGEPGSGKSRLVREVAQSAAADGVLVLYGACDAVVRTPYRPFVESLEQLARVTDPATLRAELGTSGGELVRLVPDLVLRVGELPAPIGADPDTERHRLHTAATDLFTAVSRRVPLLLVIEDGHWADPPTLLLLRHLARSAADARLLIVATFRDTDADVPEQLSEALVDLRRSEDVVRLHLAGLSGDEIAEFVSRAAGDEAGAGLPELAAAIEALTEGNAFLVTELWRTLLDSGALVVEDSHVRLTRPLDELGSPESVREVVSGRLARLEAPTTELLEVAAIIGPAFDLGVLERASALTKPELLIGLDEAMRNGLVEEVSALGLAYRFTHELVRRAVFDRLTAVRRAELHLRVGESIAAATPGADERALPDLAYHFTAAAPVGDVERAIDYNLRAARAAQSALAFDTAVALLQTALQLGVTDLEERARVLLELGAANHLAGHADAALEAFAAAAAVARDIGDAPMFAHAAVGFENASWRPGIADNGAVELLEEAATALGEEDSTLRVRVLSGLSRALANRGAHERSTIVRTNAIAMARRIDDRHGLATVLMRAYWAHGITLEGILGMLAESAELAEELGDVEIRAEAMEWLVAALIGLGDLRRARVELEAVLELAHTMGQPFILHVAEHYGATIALCEGRLAEAEQRAERSREWSRLLTGRDPSAVYGVQMFSIRREQGRLAELAPVVRILARDEGAGSSWRPGLAALLAELGMEVEARRELDRVGADGLDSLRDSPWLASLTYLVDATAAVGHRDLAALVYPELAPHAGRNVMVGYGVASYGAADRYLGMLAGTLGDFDLAGEHFESALELNRQMGMRTWLAHTGYEFGRMLLARGRADDRSRAGLLLGEARALATEIGMPSLASRTAALAPPAVAAARLPDGLSPREVDILRLVARGLSNREIGAELTISEHTAANHVRSILRKTGSANRTEAASYAHRRGLVER